MTGSGYLSLGPCMCVCVCKLSREALKVILGRQQTMAQGNTGRRRHVTAR